MLQADANHTINRRKALSALGVVGAVALVTPAAVIAANAEDTELKRLWNEWKAHWAYSLECGHVQTAAEKSVFDAVGLHWRLNNLVAPYKSCETFLARIVARRAGKEVSQLIALDTVDQTKAYELAEKWQFDRMNKEKRLERSAKRRCGFRAAELAYERSLDKVRDIEDEIAEAPAEGMLGIAIQLAVWRHRNSNDDFIHNEEMAVVSAHNALIAMTGTDLLTDVAMS